MTLRDKMLAVMQDVNSQVAEREELVELIAIALLTRNNLFILGKPGQAKSLSINLFRQRITGARQFERLLSKQTDEDQLFGRIDLSSLIPGSVPDAVLQDDDVHKNLRFDLQSMVDGLGARKDTPDTFAALEKATDKLLSYRLVTSAYMPEVASGAKPVLFGDFSSYWIADRQGRSFQRLNELYAATGQIGFRATQRVDGRLVQSEGLKCLAMKA